MSRFVYRFTFNHQRGGKARFESGGTKGTDNFARMLTRAFALKIAEGDFEFLQKYIQARVERDIQRELENVAKLFMTHVVGIAGRNRGPTGSFKTVAPEAEAMQIEGMQLNDVFIRSGQWPRRSPTYLASRAGDAWFHRTGDTLGALRSPKTWTKAFGGIRVELKRNTSMDFDYSAGDKTTFVSQPFQPGRDQSAKIAFATLRVFAMGRITADMLPALGGASIHNYGTNPRSSGLLSLLGDQVAWRLGGNPNTVPFRPTIQPFLGYFLTRAMPNAVFRRIEQGFEGTRWRWQNLRHTN